MGGVLHVRRHANKQRVPLQGYNNIESRNSACEDVVKVILAGYVYCQNTDCPCSFIKNKPLSYPVSWTELLAVINVENNAYRYTRGLAVSDSEKYIHTNTYCAVLEIQKYYQVLLLYTRYTTASKASTWYVPVSTPQQQ